MWKIGYSLLSYIIELAKMIVAGRYILKTATKKWMKGLALFVAFALVSVVFCIYIDNFAIVGVFSAVAYCFFVDNKRDRENTMIAFMLVFMANMASELFFLRAIGLRDNSSLSSVTARLIPLVLILLYALIKNLYLKHQPGLFKHLRLVLFILIFVVFAFICYSYYELNDSSGSYYSVEYFSFWGLGICGIIVLLLLMLLLKHHSEQLEINAQIAQRLIKSQKKYYTMLLQKEESSKRFRHDIKNHLLCINTLYKEGKYDALGQYLSELDTKSNELGRSFITSNRLIDIIINDICIEHPDVKLTIIGFFPGEMNMAQYDQCAVFSNLFSNAFEAAEKSEDKKVSMSIKALDRNIYICVQNTYIGVPSVKNGMLISSKRGAYHGYGISNIISSLEKYDGVYEYSFDEHTFTVDIVIPNALVKDNGAGR